MAKFDFSLPIYNRGTLIPPYWRLLRARTSKLTTMKTIENQDTEPQLLMKQDPSSVVSPTKENQPSALIDQSLFDPSPGCSLPVARCSTPTAVIETRPLCPSTINSPTINSLAQPRKLRRNGRVACLPKLQRDMVNHMLWNAIPYKNIVAALDDAGYAVTERNISNWATGGYLEWELAQEHVLQNRLDQDHMLDFLRRDDAPELPEVGLQAAATRVSQVLLQKLASAEDPEAHLESYSKMVDMLVRLNREIAVMQKQRDDSRRTLGREYDPTRVKDEEQVGAIEFERFYSNQPSDSGLSKPSVPPALPPIPTATFMAAQAREERECADAEGRQRSLDLMKAIVSKNAPASKQTENTPTPTADQRRAEAGNQRSEPLSKPLSSPLSNSPAPAVKS